MDKVDLRWGKDFPKKRYVRASRAAACIMDGGCTLREAASVLGVSHSTVYRDLHEVLPRTSPRRYRDVVNIMKRHKHRRKM